MDNLEEVFCPEVGKLIVETSNFDGEEFSTYSAKIVDVEFDTIYCSFDGNGCVIIDTENMNNIVFEIRHLKKIIDLIKKADKLTELESDDF